MGRVTARRSIQQPIALTRNKGAPSVPQGKIRLSFFYLPKSHQLGEVFYYKGKINNMSVHKKQQGFSTKLIHSGEKPAETNGAVAPILVRSKTFAWKGFDADPEFKYSRGKNPTRAILENKLVALENVPVGECFATVFSSGVAAEACLFLSLNPGDHIIFSQEIYGGTYRLIENIFSRFGITANYGNFNNPEEIEKLIKPTTRYFFVETPTNPSLHIIDLEKVNTLSKKTGIPFIVDATFAPQVTTDSFAYGAETVVYSLSKYFAGHNDVIAGAIVTKNKALDEKLRFFQGAIGAILSPDECYRVIQGVKTLDLRFRRVSETAQKVAEFLSRHKAIKRILYPGLPTHPYHEVAKKQHTAGFGSVVSFSLKDNSLKNVKRFVKKIIDSGVIIYGESLASPESILCYPALMSHKSLTKEVREKELGIDQGFFRFSVGLEDADDIILALTNALNK